MYRAYGKWIVMMMIKGGRPDHCLHKTPKFKKHSKHHKV